MEAEWSGKVVVVYLRDPPEVFDSGIPFQSPRFETVRGELFLVGTVPDQIGEWAGGNFSGVRWSDVTNFLVFESPEEFATRSAAEDQPPRSKPSDRKPS